MQAVALEEKATSQCYWTGGRWSFILKSRLSINSSVDLASWRVKKTPASQRRKVGKGKFTPSLASLILFVVYTIWRGGEREREEMGE